MTKDLEEKYRNLNEKKRYELLHYSKKQHLQLLNQQAGKIDPKLRTYSIILSDHLNWEIREQYSELLQDYMEKKIDILHFRIKFLERYESIEKVANFLKSNKILLTPDEQSLDFGILLSKINGCCEAYSNDPEPFRSKFEIGDIEFRNSIEKIYLKIQDFFGRNDK